MTKKQLADIRFTYGYILSELNLRELEGVERGRLDKALTLAISDDPLTKYKTCWETCECADQGYRMSYICKHRLALMLRHRTQVVLCIFSGQKLYDSKFIIDGAETK